MSKFEAFSGLYSPLLGLNKLCKSHYSIRIRENTDRKNFQCGTLLGYPKIAEVLTTSPNILIFARGMMWFLLYQFINYFVRLFLLILCVSRYIFALCLVFVKVNRVPSVLWYYIYQVDLRIRYLHEMVLFSSCICKCFTWLCFFSNGRIDIIYKR